MELIHRRVLVTMCLIVVFTRENQGLTSVEEKWFTQKLSPLNSYKTAQMVIWRVPSQTLKSAWRFTSNSSASCHNHNVTIWLKFGGFPVVSLDGGRFPAQIQPVQENQHSLNFSAHSGGILELEGPSPGSWYMMAGISNNLPRGCTSQLLSTVEYQVVEDIITIVPVYQEYQDIRIFNTISNLQYYKFFVPDGANSGNVTITKCSLRVGEGLKQQRVSICPLLVTSSPRSIPTSTTKARNCTSEETVGCSTEIETVPGSWHYISVTTTKVNPVEFAISVTLKGCRTSPRQTSPMMVNKIDTAIICGTPGKRTLQLIFPPTSGQSADVCGPHISLHRRNSPGFFSFDFVLSGNSSGPEMLSLKPGENTVLSFELGERDVGGTLAVELALLTTRGTPPDLVRETMGCLSQGFVSTPVYSHTGGYASYHCRQGRVITQNSTQSENGIVFEQMMIPYPAAGRYYLTLTSHCYSKQDRPNEDCTAIPIQVLFAVHSNSCVSGSCGRYGQCYQYVSGESIFSSCHCVAGHRGWGCNDPELSIPDFKLLVTTLLLTLTNMATLPAVVLALFRGHYTESFVYFSNLISSSLYHACNQDVYSVCILNFTVLRFCDIFTGILSCWVTLLAMAALPHSIRALFHMVGALGISLAIQQNSESSLTQVVPFLIGSVVLLVSWIWKCSAYRKFYPGWKYLGLYCIPGILVATAGQLCLRLAPQHTHQQYLHSSWHVAKGVALMLLLPETPSLDEPTKSGGNEGNSSNHLNQFQGVPESSFKHLTDSNQSSVDDMAAVTRMNTEENSSQHQL